MRLLVVKDQNGGGDGGRPAAMLVADGRLRDVGGAHNLVGNAVNLFLLIPALVGIEVEIESSGEHLGGELFSVVAGLVFSFAEAVMLGEIAVGALVRRNGDADGADDEAVCFACGIF